MPKPTWNDRVLTCDNFCGRISFVYRAEAQAKAGLAMAIYYRVSFPGGSPYFDNWAVYRQREVVLTAAYNPADAVQIQSVVDSLRPRIPKP